MTNALQRTDRWVARTQNWMYDHLRCLQGYRAIVLSDVLENEQEFPDIEARVRSPRTLPRSVWGRLSGDSLFPSDRIWLKGLAPAVLHSHFGYVAAQDHQLARFLGIPWLVSFYGADAFELPRRPDWQERYGLLFEGVTKVLALGPYMAARLEDAGCPKEKLEVHPLGVDGDALPYRQRNREPGDPLRILFAGTFREKKGVPYLLEAVAELTRDGIPVRLDLVGDAASKRGDQEMKEEIFRLIRHLDLQDVVTSRPLLPFVSLLQLAMECHVLAAPSVTAENGDAEGTPFIIQQMMATGMPVISTLHSDIPFIFGPLAHRLVPERDAAAIAQALRRYAEDPMALPHDGQAFREHVQGALSVRNRAAHLAGIYDQVVQGTGRSRNEPVSIPPGTPSGQTT